MVCAFRRLSIPGRVALQRRHGDVFWAASSRNNPVLCGFRSESRSRGRWLPAASGSPPARRRSQSPRRWLCAPRRSAAPVRNARRRPARRGRRFRRHAPPAAGLNLAAIGQILDPQARLAAGMSRSLLNRSLSGRPTIMRTSSGALSLSRTGLPTYCPSRRTLTRSESSYTSAMRWLI